MASRPTLEMSLYPLGHISSPMSQATLTTLPISSLLHRSSCRTALESADHWKRVLDCSRRVVDHLGPHLPDGYQVLVTYGVDDEARLHAIGSQEDGIAVDEMLGYGGLGDVAHYGFIPDGWVGFSCNPFGDGDLM